MNKVLPPHLLLLRLHVLGGTSWESGALAVSKEDLKQVHMRKISIQLTSPAFPFILFFLLFQCILLPLEPYFTKAGFPSNFLQVLPNPIMLTRKPSFLLFPSFWLENFRDPTKL